MFPKHTRFLLVDDMPKMRQIVASQMNSLGFMNIHLAVHGKEALNILSEQHQLQKPIDVVLSDWNMPIMSGLEFLIEVRKSNLFKKLPFIMITAEGQRDQVMQAIKEGVSNYIVKPFPPVQLELKLQAVWEKISSHKAT